VLSASIDAGISSPGRLHDLLVATEAVTPGELRSRGSGLVLRTGTGPTPFGEAFVATTGRGLHRLEFTGEAGPEEPERELARAWPRAELVRDDASARRTLERVFEPPARPKPLHLWLRGTNFQLQVWQALLRIPPGRLCSYTDLARFVEAPRAVRAVAGAVAANRLAFVIPCHRVLRLGGELGGYRYGLARKLAMLGWEAARSRV
jgi:AraC family transcriptional regulator of adaptative response/methylated-DNA-[protein]-cysteine methyltransferase